jgi:hypothetical protein
MVVGNVCDSISYTISGALLRITAFAFIFFVHLRVASWFYSSMCVV